jgi:hypothetical protein
MTEPTALTLNWQGPYSWRSADGTSVFDCDFADSAGIYVWAVPTPEGRLLY